MSIMDRLSRFSGTRAAFFVAKINFFLNRQVASWGFIKYVNYFRS